ncbi:class I adenylate-forming enzyme family protein [Pseudorhodoferax sp.]|uniref:class I adenylate-forming enzyme family protein n=1 Tax=Pseudorhodoferax sp. TaxID=1993553 RepID=UPI002DD64D4F|nr:AMP-binding protein [Pseudorhodoferax sp.]
MRIADYFDATAERQPDRVALLDDGHSLDFGQAQRFVHAIAHALDRQSGLRAGAHIALYSPNDWRVPLLLLGINRSDRVWLSAHTRNPVQVNTEVLAFMDCEFVFFHSAFEDVVPQLKAGLPQAIGFVCIDRTSRHGPALEDWIDGDAAPYRAGLEDPLATAFIQPTGGTTGPSKAAIHTQRGLEMALIAGREVAHHSPASRYLAVAPLTHAGGITALVTLCCGGSVVVMNLTGAEQVLDAIERWRVTHLFLPPTLLYMLCDAMQARPRDVASLRHFVTGAAPVAPEKMKLATRLFGPVMCEGYGQTEGGMPLIYKQPADYLLEDGGFDEAALASTGRAVPFARVEIMDEAGRILPPGERGEIVLQSSLVMQAYYKNEAETEAIGRHGWRHTGDVGVKDARGFITIVDRLKDMIVTGGFNVFPAQIEAVILEHAAVLDCAVVGVPDDKWGEAVKAVVQLRPGHAVDAEALVARCRDRLGSVHAPKSVEFWNDLPRSAVGKLLRREVRAKFWSGHWRAI